MQVLQPWSAEKPGSVKPQCPLPPIGFRAVRGRLLGPNLHPAGENENEHNDQDDAKDACRKWSPSSAVRPSGNCADKENDQNYEKYCSEWQDITSWVRRLLEKAARGHQGRVSAASRLHLSMQGIASPLENSPPRAGVL